MGIKIGSGTPTENQTEGDGSLYVSGHLEVDGVIHAGTIEGTLEGTITGDIAQSQVTDLETDLAAKVDETTVITATSPIRINGGASADLSTGRTISISAATAGAAGSMSAADFLKLFQATASASNSTLMLRDSSALASVGTCTSSGHIANKGYVDTAFNSFVFKQACRVVATSILNPSGLATTVDGKTLIAGDRVLLTAQFPTSANGIYLAASGSWTRATDFDSSAEMITGSLIPVAEGTTYAKTIWQLQLKPETLNTDDVEFEQCFIYTAGDGLDLTGTEFSVDMAAIEIEQSQVTDLESDLATINAAIDEIDNKVAKADINRARKGNINVEYESASDSDTARATQLRAANAAATSGDVITLNAGDYDLGALLHLDVTAGVTIKGQGFDRTRVYSALPMSVDDGNAILTLNNNVTLEDFYIHATLTNSNYQIPLGTQQSVHSFTNVTLRRMRVKGGTDAFFAWASGGHSMKAYDSYFESLYDTVAILKSGSNPLTGGVYEFHNCTFIATAPYEGADAEGGGPPAEVVNNFLVKSGTCLLVNPRFITTNTNVDATRTTGVGTIASSGADIVLINPFFDVTSDQSGGTVVDIRNVGLGTITVYGGTSANNGGVITSTGDVVFLPIGALASATQSGPLSSTDWSTFNSKVATSRTINTTAPITGGGTLAADRTIAIAAAASGVDGYLTAADWATFSGKVATSRTISTTSPLTGGGDLSSNRTIAIPAAATGTSGYLTSTDWNTFNGKGSVSSVALSLPSIITVSGSPVTTTGTLTGTLATQTAALVFAGPVSGSAAAPTFRALANTDLPNTVNWAGVATLTGCKYRRLAFENAGSGNIDFGTTVTSGKRWLISRLEAYNTAGTSTTVSLQYKSGGSYFTLCANSTVNASLQAAFGLAGFIYDAGETVAITTSQAGLNVFLTCLEFDNTSPLRTIRTTALASGDNTLYTCPASTSAIMLDASMHPMWGGSTGGTVVGIHFYNASGGTRTYTGNFVASGGSVASTNRCFSSSVNNNTRGTVAAITTLSTGDFININSDSSASNQMAWCHVAEQAG